MRGLEKLHHCNVSNRGLPKICGYNRNTTRYLISHAVYFKYVHVLSVP